MTTSKKPFKETQTDVAIRDDPASVLRWLRTWAEKRSQAGIDDDEIQVLGETRT